MPMKGQIHGMYYFKEKKSLYWQKLIPIYTDKFSSMVVNNSCFAILFKNTTENTRLSHFYHKSGQLMV